MVLMEEEFEYGIPRRTKIPSKIKYYYTNVIKVVSFNNIKVYLTRSIREWQYISYEKSNIKKSTHASEMPHPCA